MNIDALRNIFPEESDHRSHSDRCAECEDPRNVVKVSLAGKKTAPMKAAVDAVRAKYVGKLTDSDTRQILLIPTDEAEKFLDVVFDLNTVDERV
jgi:hypothetical protein